MRLIGNLDDERKAIVFSQFLQQKGIPHQIEIQTEKDWGSHAYGSHECQVWIYEEEHVEEVTKWLHQFKDDPYHPIFNLSPSTPTFKRQPLPPPSQTTGIPSSVPPPPPRKAKISSWDQQPMGWLTRSLLIICSLLFFLSHTLTPNQSIPERYEGLILFTSPIEKVLLFDYPKFYQLLDRFFQNYGFEQLESPQDLPPEGQRLLQRINETPVWPGYYQLILTKGWKAAVDGLSQYPTFEKIKEGQLWRLVSPCLLHGDIFHLFFNMLWLIVLGKQLEQRLKPLRYAIFMIIVGVISNTAQYLMSGSNFIGFSGILCGMLAFIWMRQKYAAWEGYQIDRLTMIFMLLFIIGMAAIQLLSFVLEKSFNLAFSPNIANMAHLAGGMVGFLLGRLNFFSWRHD